VLLVGFVHDDRGRSRPTWLIDRRWNFQNIPLNPGKTRLSSASTKLIFLLGNERSADIGASALTVFGNDETHPIAGDAGADFKSLRFAGGCS
jgi:hypothetical protein